MFKTLLDNVKIETLIKREIHARIGLVEDVTTTSHDPCILKIYKYIQFIPKKSLLHYIKRNY